MDCSFKKTDPQFASISVKLCDIALETPGCVRVYQSPQLAGDLHDGSIFGLPLLVFSINWIFSKLKYINMRTNH